jgi:hypothetical protein
MCLYDAPPLARGLEPNGIVASQELTATACERSLLRIAKRHLNVLVGERASLSGTLEEGEMRAPAGRTLSLERRDGRVWRTFEHARTQYGGRFSFSYLPRRTGTATLRVAFGGSTSAQASTRVSGRLEVFRLAGASWYGGGGTLACGGELTSYTLGVANRTLPCGTIVTLRYGDRTVRVPVVDRGPFVEGREFDLTEATKRELGFGDTGDVWTTS